MHSFSLSMVFHLDPGSKVFNIRFTGSCHGECGLPGAQKHFGLETIVDREPCVERERESERVSYLLGKLCKERRTEKERLKG